MAGIRYTGTFYNEINVKWTFSIYDSEFTGTATTVSIENARHVVKGDVNSRFNPILETAYTLTLWNEATVNLDQLITDIQAAEDQRFALFVYREDVFQWVGWLVLDILMINDEPKPRLTELTFSDNISTLEGFAFVDEIKLALKGNIPSTFNVSGFVYRDFQRFTDLIINALQKLGTFGFYDSTYNPSANVLATYVDWWNTEMTRLQANDPLYLSRVMAGVFAYIDDDYRIQCSTSREVLEQICLLWGARLIQANGVWNLIQINTYNNNTVFVRYYDKDKVTTGNANVSLNNAVDQINKHKLATGTDTYLPALVRVEIPTFSANGGDILIPYDINTVLETWISAGDLLQDDELYIEFDVKERYEFTLSGSLYTSFQPAYELRARLDGGASFIYETRSKEWKFHVWNTLKEQQRDEKCIFVISDLAKVAGGALEIQFKQSAFYRQDVQQTWATDGSWGFSFVITNFRAYIVRNGEIVTKRRVLAFNQDSAANDRMYKYIYEHNEIMLGENDGGIVQVWDGSAWTNTNEWNVYTETGNDLAILSTLAQEILSGQKTICPVMQAEIQGSISTMDGIVYDSNKYLIAAGEYDLRSGVWQGEWFKVGRDTRWIVFENLPVERGGGFTQIGGLSESVSDLQRRFTQLFTDDDEPVININNTQSTLTFTLDDDDDTKVLTIADLSGVTLLDASEANFEIFLPQAPEYNVICEFVSIGSGVITITASGTDTIEGAADYDLVNQYQSVKLQYITDIATWIIK